MCKVFRAIQASYINPKNSIRQIAKACNMTDTEIRRIVYGLLQAGLVQLVRPPGMQAPPAQQPAPITRRATPIVPPSTVKRSVVERLIARIKES